MRNTLIIGAEKSANASGLFFAMVLGEISPKISIATVSTAVLTADASSLFTISLANTSAPIEDARMFTMLLPISIVEINES